MCRETISRFFGRGRRMIKLDYIPDGYNEIVEYYGNPDPEGDGNFDHDFWDSHMKLFPLPFPLRIGWDPSKIVQNVWMHQRVGDAIVDALREIGEKEGVQSLKDRNLDKYWGCFAFRFKRVNNTYSTHSWAIAIDLNRRLGKLGKPSKMPHFIVDAFKKRGFEWGGDWQIPDGMHFQACTGY